MSTLARIMRSKPRNAARRAAAADEEAGPSTRNPRVESPPPTYRISVREVQGNESDLESLLSLPPYEEIAGDVPPPYDNNNYGTFVDRRSPRRREEFLREETIMYPLVAVVAAMIWFAFVLALVFALVVVLRS